MTEDPTDRESIKSKLKFWRPPAPLREVPALPGLVFQPGDESSAEPTKPRLEITHLPPRPLPPSGRCSPSAWNAGANTLNRTRLARVLSLGSPSCGWWRTKANGGLCWRPVKASRRPVACCSAGRMFFRGWRTAPLAGICSPHQCRLWVQRWPFAAPSDRHACGFHNLDRL
jgi:hypothetical protein